MSEASSEDAKGSSKTEGTSETPGVVVDEDGRLRFKTLHANKSGRSDSNA